MALPSLPGIFHRLPAGLTEVTRAWGGGGQAQACPRGSGPPPRPRPTLRPLLSSHLRQALLLCPDHLLWHVRGLSRPRLEPLAPVVHRGSPSLLVV